MRERNCKLKNYIFDLYGTLVDIHTDEEKPALWKAMAFLFSMTGASYTPDVLRRRYGELVDEETELELAAAGKRLNGGELLPQETEIQLSHVFVRLLEERGVKADQAQLGQIGMTFRSLSLEYIRLYEKVPKLLAGLRAEGKQIYLLSNAQRMFTEPEMRMLGIYDCFDGILYSSDAGVKKPSPYFFDALFQKYGLKKEESVMIGNEYRADILGARAYGIRSLYVHTAQSGERPASLPESCQEIADIGQVAGSGGIEFEK